MVAGVVKLMSLITIGCCKRRVRFYATDSNQHGRTKRPLPFSSEKSMGNLDFVPKRQCLGTVNVSVIVATVDRPADWPLLTP